MYIKLNLVQFFLLVKDVISFFINFCILFTFIHLLKHRTIKKRFYFWISSSSLNHPGPNYAPQSSRFEHVSIEMNQPLAVIGTSDGYKTIDASENTDLETDNVNARDDKTRKHPYEKWNKDFFGEFLWKKKDLENAVYSKISIGSLDKKLTCILVI